MGTTMAEDDNDRSSELDAERAKEVEAELERIDEEGEDDDEAEEDRASNAQVDVSGGRGGEDEY